MNLTHRMFVKKLCDILMTTMHKQIYNLLLICIIGVIVACGSIPMSGQTDVQNILDADIVIRIRAVDEVRDFGLIGKSLSPSLITTYPGGYKENKAPTFEGQLTRRGFGWYEWPMRNSAEAKRLLQAIDPKTQIKHLSFSENRSQVAMSIMAFKKFVATEIVVLDVNTLSITGRKHLRESRYVADLLWEPNSQSLLLIEYTERYSFSPLGILAAASGHPMPYMDYYIARLDLNTMDLVESETPFLSNVNSGMAVFFIPKKKSDKGDLDKLLPVTVPPAIIEKNSSGDREVISKQRSDSLQMTIPANIEPVAVYLIPLDDFSFDLATKLAWT